MSLIDIIKIGSQIAAGVGFLGAGIGFLVYSFKKSTRDESKAVTESADTIADFWKNQANEYKTMMATKDEKYTSQINELTTQVGELRGQLNAEKATNERLEKIFQNRNPEMEEFIRYMVQAVQNINEVHTSMVKVLSDIHAMSTSNHEMLAKELKIETTIIKN